MDIRRIILSFVVAIPLAGAIVWFVLAREQSVGTSPTSTNVASSREAAPLSRDAREKEGVFRSSDVATVSVASHPPATRPAKKQADPTAPKRFLPEESRLIMNDQLNENAAQTMLRSTRFDDFVQKMRDEMAANTAAKDVGELYIGAIQNDLADIHGLTIGEFACGATLCVGSIDVRGDNSNWDQWIKKFDDNQNAPTYVFFETPVDRVNGVTQHRIVFSTDPDSNALTGAL